MGNNLENHMAKRKQERGLAKQQRFYGWLVLKAQHCWSYPGRRRSPSGKSVVAPLSPRPS